MIWYISGPMKNMPDSSRELFEATRIRYTELFPNDIFINPFHVKPWRHVGECPGNNVIEGSPHKAACYMRADLFELLRTADGIMLLPGWENAFDARLEFLVAQACGMEIGHVN